MAAFFSFILMILFFAFIVVCVMAFRIYRSFRNTAKKFSDFMGGTRNSGQSHSTKADGDGEVIIDRRSPDEAKRKIFSKHEGEYVDFEEEK